MAKSQRILALDVGASAIKLAEFASSRAGDIELVNFGVSSLELDQAHESERLMHITATIKELMQECQIKPGPVLISVTGQSVFSRFVKLPPVDKEKVYQIILYEAQQNVPFPINEVVWDYQLIGRGDGELDVMLAAIKADIIVGLTDAVEQAGLTTDIVDVAPMALYNAVRYNYTDTSKCTLIIDIGSRSTDLIFMEESRVFIRSVPVAGNAITQQIMREFELSFEDAEEMKKAHAFVAFGGAYEEPKSEVAGKVSKIVRNVMTRMHTEIDRSIKFYRTQQSGSQPSQILLTGGSSTIPYSDVFLKEKLKVDVDYLNPFINVPVSSRIEGEEIGRHAHELAQVVGLALRKALTCPIEINLLPPRVVEEKAFRKKQPMLIAAMVGLVLTVGIWSVYYARLAGVAGETRDIVQNGVQALEAVERPLRDLEDQVRKQEEKIGTLSGLIENRQAWLGMLAELQANLPETLWITSLQPVRTTAEQAAATPGVPEGSIRALTVRGMGYIDQVASPVPITEYRNRLRESPLFSEATEFSSLPSPVSGEYIRQFTLQVVLENPITL
ncbi:MAG TPA: type IV pilus assembly protein PilM [Kiritimatiellia bacterium]|nr:type IV pilus assembly protein PilM [Kiritimatiellia bacterium]